MSKSEFEQAKHLVERVLDKPYIDPDGDICLLARQFLLLRNSVLEEAAKACEDFGTDYSGQTTEDYCAGKIRGLKTIQRS